MRYFLILSIIFYSLFAFDLKSFVKAYKEKKYKQVCQEGARNFSSFKKDSDIITMYAFACLYNDQIDSLNVPIIFLKNRPQDRKNRAYFSLIVAQKALLANALFDKQKYEGLNIPYTDYVLSRVFNLFFQNRYTLKNNKYKMKDDKGEYLLYVGEKKGKRVFIIEEIKENNNTIHYYR